MRRLGAPEEEILVVQGNLANTYQLLKRYQEVLPLRRDVYSGRLQLNGEEYCSTLRAASNYAYSLVDLQRFEEAKALLNKSLPVARRVLGESHHLTLYMQLNNARALYMNTEATLDDLHEAVTTLEDAERIARRVLGGAHPITESVKTALRTARAALRARETRPPRR